ncbi:MAG: 4Fe-4S binding protein [Senegalimassilia anaerobia]|nr:4Fe-4S binding protein [Senegalimassilia anaerobia]
MGLLRRLFGLKSPAQKRAEKARKRLADADNGGENASGDSVPAGQVAAVVVESAKSGALATIVTESGAPDSGRGGAGDSRMWVLGGALLSTAAFGFPVFCLVCPVGLTFATIICLWRALQFGEATLSLLVFPAILVVEVVVLRRWCHNLCPLGALMSLIARGNKTFRATLDDKACLRLQGVACGKCADACPEGIDLHDGALSTPRHECIKCGECRFACPVQAITFPFLPKKGDDAPVKAGVAQANESRGEAHE